MLHKSDVPAGLVIIVSPTLLKLHHTVPVSLTQDALLADHK